MKTTWRGVARGKCEERDIGDDLNRPESFTTLVNGLADHHRDREGVIVVGWGAHRVARERAYPCSIECIESVRPMCLGHNADGSPKHPLYLRSDAPFEPWRGYPDG